MTIELLTEVSILREKVEKYEKAIEDIKAEIDKARYIDKDTKICKNALASGLEVAMEIIEKHIGGKE